MENNAAAAAEMIEKVLSSYVPEDGEPLLTEAMRYSLLNGGKRFRAGLVLKFAELFGGDMASALPLACAIEMVHAHSLIHDDLPCMDDDDIRRGKPSCHIAYGEATALLAGDALLALAFETVSEAKTLGDSQKVRATALLSSSAGASGMLGGQRLDKKYEKIAADEEALDMIQSKKTGALIAAACLLGCTAADVQDGERLSAARRYGEAVGRAFQITDDILDLTSSTQVLGKPVGSDKSMNKSTYVTVMGLEAARKRAKELTEAAVKSVEPFGRAADELIRTARSITEREF